MCNEPNTLYVRCELFPESTKNDLIKFLDQAGITYEFVLWLHFKNYAFVRFPDAAEMEHGFTVINDALFSGEIIRAWR